MDNTNANKGCNKAVGAALHTPQASGQPPYLRGAVIGALLAILFLALGLASCNVTRTITTTAQTVQRGDTTVTIMTKTVETYDGSLTDPRLR